MQAIQTTNLVRRYNDLTAVDSLNLEITQGELFSLLGVNGAGKTTTIKMLSCLTKPTEGDALVGGHSIVREPALVKALIGVSPQETAIGPNLTVTENLELICGIHGFSREKTRRKISELTRMLSLDSVQNRKAGKLSGGGSAGSASPWRSSASRRFSFWMSPPWVWTSSQDMRCGM